MNFQDDLPLLNIIDLGKLKYEGQFKTKQLEDILFRIILVMLIGCALDEWNNGRRTLTLQ